jgi:hypothetical protein
MFVVIQYAAVCISVNSTAPLSESLWLLRQQHPTRREHPIDHPGHNRRASPKSRRGCGNSTSPPTRCVRTCTLRR